MWIDAICINQADIPERNHVVGHMKNIYERADRILAWLGPESENGGEALLAIASIYGHFTKLVGELGTQEDAFERMLGDRGWAGHEDKQAGEKWWAINSLLTKRTWFHRVWIVQEVCGSSFSQWLPDGKAGQHACSDDVSTLSSQSACRGCLRGVQAPTTCAH